MEVSIRQEHLSYHQMLVKLYMINYGMGEIIFPRDLPTFKFLPICEQLISAPLMIVQFYYDEVQMQMNGINPKNITHEDEETLVKLINEVKTSLANLE